MNATARRLIAALALEPLPGEGGFFRPTWRNASASAIYFLLTPDSFSALHRLKQDEMWHFHAGDRVEHIQLDARSGMAHRVIMGPGVLADQQPQVLVKAGVWQGARIAAGRAKGGPSRTRRVGYALLGCTVAPPWDERGFELAIRADLSREFPAHGSLIRALTR